MSVTLATDPRGDLTPILARDIQPVPLETATELIQNLSNVQERSRAQAQAFTKLASAAFIHRAQALDTFESDRLKEHLSVLSTKEDVSEIEKELDTAKQIPTQGALLGAISKRFSRAGSLSQVRPDAALPSKAVPPPSKAVSPSASPRRLSPSVREGRILRVRPPGRGEGPALARGLMKQPFVGKAQSQLNLKTLKTRVDVASTSQLSFEMLARVLDPREWSASPFWPESSRVDLAENTHRFTPIPLPKSEAVFPLGWEGYLLEHVEWNWNLSTISSFKNYLTIKYKVDQVAKTIELAFSLYSCAGSQFYALVNRRGVDVDWGYQRVTSANKNKAAPWSIETQKNVRFSDFLNRRTPFEGSAGSGQVLSYLAPAVVGLWMSDLLERLDTLMVGPE